MLEVCVHWRERQFWNTKTIIIILLLKTLEHSIKKVLMHARDIKQKYVPNKIKNKFEYRRFN